MFCVCVCGWFWVPCFCQTDWWSAFIKLRESRSYDGFLSSAPLSGEFPVKELKVLTDSLVCWLCHTCLKKHFWNWLAQLMNVRWERGLSQYLEGFLGRCHPGDVSRQPVVPPGSRSAQPRKVHIECDVTELYQMVEGLMCRKGKHSLRCHYNS